MVHANQIFGEGYLTPAQKQQQAKAWVESSPEAADARNAILHILKDAPLHAAALGEFGEQFKIPKPVSSVVRELCGDLVRYFNAKESPNGNPAFALSERAEDGRYWQNFRKTLEGVAGNEGLNPWILLGVATTNPSGASSADFILVRSKVFVAFWRNRYGEGVIKSMASVCLDFKKFCGMSFSDFFNGLRPVDFMESVVGRSLMNWSWTTAQQPCLNCELKHSYAHRADPGTFVPPQAIVSDLIPLATRFLPENLDIRQFLNQGYSEDDIWYCYLVALKQALKRKVENTNETKNSLASEDAVRQLLEVSRELASVTHKVASIAERLAERLIAQSAN